MAARFDITIDQGASFSLVVTVKNSSGALVDFTGYTGSAQIRALPESTTVIATMTVTFNNPATDGVINLALGASTTAAIATNTDLTSDRTLTKYCYDVLVTSGSGAKTRIMEGLAVVSPAATRS